MLVTAALVLAVALLAICYPDRPPGVQSRKGIVAVTPAYALVGNLPWIVSIIRQRTRILDEVYRLQNEQAPGGKPFTLTFPALGGRVTVINNPAYLQYIQKTNFDNFPKGPDQRRIMCDVLGIHGIFASDGAIWLKQRKLATHIFSFNNFRTHVQSTVVREVHTLDALLQDASHKQAPVNLPDTMFRFTLNSFAWMAFDADVDCLPSRVEGLAVPNEFASSFDYAQMVMDHRIFALLPKWSEWFTREGYHMRKSLRTLNRYCYRIIDSRLARREKLGAGNATDKAGKDLLELFMDRGLTREELLPVILNFLIAGRDTTAQSLAWLFFELWKSPQYIDKIRQSLVPLLGAPGEQRPMQFDEIKELPLLQACFYEAVRLWPAVPKNLKRVVQDDIIRPTGEHAAEGLPDVDVRGGETVLWSDWCMARMPEVWGADCCEFRPERFLETGSDGSLRVAEFSQFKFHSFNAGPRMCLGKTLATYEGMAVTAAILGRYDVLFDDHTMRTNPPTYGDSLTLPCSPYYVRFRPIAT
ncbi:cytochrome P450 [Acaromyces ingoldii]|uniref:Cytochrome P450 n=1 Tax=Acaromyces ingoldii TaxID=215250 RepID=A0A316YBG6_9BASI|nr:cytochrome P450 [Acaromyces ingoldii]PWN86887.1 cytochrome P450 [Acaromyces ingoldii]